MLNGNFVAIGKVAITVDKLTIKKGEEKKHLTTKNLS